MTTATATIARSKDQAEVAKAREKFWILYSGPLLVLEDHEVQESVHVFADCLDSTSKCKGPLPELAEDIARAAGRSAGNQWYPSGASRDLTARVQ